MILGDFHIHSTFSDGKVSLPVSGERVKPEIRRHRQLIQALCRGNERQHATEPVSLHQPCWLPGLSKSAKRLVADASDFHGGVIPQVTQRVNSGVTPEATPRSLEQQLAKIRTHTRSRSLITDEAVAVGMKTRVRNEIISVKHPMLFSQGS